MPYTTLPAMEMMTLKSVNFGEKVMNDSSDSPVDFFSPSTLPLHHLVLLWNEKWVNVGIKTREGCARIVFSMSLCQQEANPRRRPGRKIVAMMVAITGNLCSSRAPSHSKKQ